MKVLSYYSDCTPSLNAKIMRSIEAIACRHHKVFPDGWRALIELQRENENKPYYALDIQSNKGGGDYAVTKMEMLNHFPNLAATGGSNPDHFYTILNTLTNTEHIPDSITAPILKKLTQLNRLSELNDDYWRILSPYGVTHYYGGIRIPYEILVTEHTEGFTNRDDGEQSVIPTSGEIRISFSGAKEWEDLFFTLCILADLQNTLNELWSKDQIWYNFRELKADPHIALWIDLLDLREA